MTKRMNYGSTSAMVGSSSDSESSDRDESLGTNFRGKIRRYRTWLGDRFESHQAHWIIIGLIVADFAAVMSVIIVSFLWPEFEEEEHEVFEALELIAFTINSIFVVEVILKLFVFGFDYYMKGAHWTLHLFDAIIICTTFLLEIFLKGKQREVAGLLILFRLWRLVKVLSIVAVGLMEYDDNRLDQLVAEQKRLKEEFARVLTEIDKIAREDHWSEQKRALIFRNYQIDLLNENHEPSVGIDI